MQHLICLVLALLSCFQLALGLPGVLPARNSTRNSKRGNAVIPERPDGVSFRAFHGSQFENFDSLGFEWDSPAVEHAPVFLFSRTGRFTVSIVHNPRNRDWPDGFQSPCYPESATVLGSNPVRPNPGTWVPISANPGENCMSPGSYFGGEYLFLERLVASF
jgi:hypothetical protein